MDGPPGSPEPQPAPGAPAPGAPSAHPSELPPQNGKAIASLILGIAGCCLIGLLAAVPAIILAVMARKEMRENPGQWRGEGMATAGLVLGIIGTIVSILVVLFYGALLIAVLSGGGFDAYCEDNPDDELCADEATAVDPWMPHAGLMAAPDGTLPIGGPWSAVGG